MGHKEVGHPFIKQCFIFFSSHMIMSLVNDFSMLIISILDFLNHYLELGIYEPIGKSCVTESVFSL